MRSSLVMYGQNVEDSARKMPSDMIVVVDSALETEATIKERTANKMKNLTNNSDLLDCMQ